MFKPGPSTSVRLEAAVIAGGNGRGIGPHKHLEVMCPSDCGTGFYMSVAASARLL